VGRVAGAALDAQVAVRPRGPSGRACPRYTGERALWAGGCAGGGLRERVRRRRTQGRPTAAGAQSGAGRALGAEGVCCLDKNGIHAAGGKGP